MQHPVLNHININNNMIIRHLQINNKYLVISSNFEILTLIRPYTKSVQL